MMGDGDDNQFVTTHTIDNAIRPVAYRVTAYPSADSFADVFELKKERKLAFHGLDEQLAIPVPLLVIVIARFDQLATSFFTYH
jgi:hypothetical protein